MGDYFSWLKTIYHTPDTDGGGSIFVPTFYKLLKDKKVDTLFEWCSGPAWIGIFLLEKGICKELVLADINAKAIEQARMTLKSKGLLDKCRLYVSDNLKDIDTNERFDLVVANPPNYCNIRRDHPLARMANDLRPSDIGWELHYDFYKFVNQSVNAWDQLGRYSNEF